MIYVLYDKPQELEDMSFLTTEFKKEYKEIYPKWRCTSIRKIFFACVEVMKLAGNGDTIVCWYDFMGVLCWWLNRLANKKIKIVAINILLKDKNTVKNKIVKFFYKKALLSRFFTATVTTAEYGHYLNRILDTKVNFTILHDVYHKNYELNKYIELQNNTVFCGGRNGRNWELLFKIAQQLPDVTFTCVMPHAIKKRFLDIICNNICIKTDIPEDIFIELLCHSQLIVMPLDTEAPAGLTVYFQAAANNKMIITSDTVTTKGYISHGRGVLCSNDIEEWKDKIQYYLQHKKEADAIAVKLKNFLENECSEKKYAKTLWEMLTE